MVLLLRLYDELDGFNSCFGDLVMDVVGLKRVWMQLHRIELIF